MKPILTVLITSYNKADTIEKCLDSVLAQKCQYPLKITVLDDGSTDDTHAKLKRYEDRVTVRRFNHRGLPDSITQGIWECDARFVAVLGADDYWKDDNKLELQISHMIHNPYCGLCYTNGLFVTDSGERIMINQTPDTTYDGLLARTNFVCASMVFRPEILRATMTRDKFASFMSYDYPLIVLYAYFSRVDYLPYCTTVSLLTTTESLTRTHRRGPRLNFIINAKLRTHWYFISRYGCEFKTGAYLFYRYARDIYSVIFRRWYK
jgi:glycosyltransferase involved in cell wall biosynthesis